MKIKKYVLNIFLIMSLLFLFGTTVSAAEGDVYLKETNEIKYTSAFMDTDVNARNHVKTLPELFEIEVSGRLYDMTAAFNAYQINQGHWKHVLILPDATNLVIQAEASASQADVDVAQNLVNDLTIEADKTGLQYRLNAVQGLITAETDAANLVESQYTTDSWQILTNALNMAQDTTEQKVAKTNAIYSAIEGLIFKEVSYTVNYLEQDTNKVLATAKTGTGTFGTAVSETALAIEGYSAVDPTEVSITLAVEGHEINFYYIVNQYTITFDSAGGSAVDSITQDYGTDVTAPENPTREGYTFAGWDVEVPTTMPAGDLIITATWTINKYTVTFVNGEDTLQSEELEYGATPEYKGETPTKKATAEFTYTFAGWDPEIVDVTGDATYTATYSATKNTYTVKFVDEDGTTVLDEQTVKYGETPEYKGDTPTKTATAEFTYTFAGWDPEISTVTGNVTYQATFDSVVNEYTVTFVDEDGTVLETQTLKYGETPEYKGDTPTKKATAEFTYTFAGWDPVISVVTGDVTYKATYSSVTNKYKVTFIDYNGDELKAEEVEYGSRATAPADPERVGYTFTGWDVEFDNVKEALTVTAQYTINKYTITFDSAGGSAVASITQDYGTEVTAPENPTKTGYTFDKWVDVEGQEVTFPLIMPVDGMSLKATWTANTDTAYKVEHYQKDVGAETFTLVDTDNLTGTTATDTAAAAKTYAGFTAGTVTQKVIAADGTTVVRIEYTRNNYQVTFETDGGSTVGAITQDYGSEVTAPENPTREGYTFDKWIDGKGQEVTFPLTMPVDGLSLKATWTINQYTVTFSYKDADGNPLTSTATVEYGSKATAPELPTRQYYTFDRWDKSFDKVTGDITVTAIYKGSKEGFLAKLDAAIAQIEVADVVRDGDNFTVTFKEDAQVPEVISAVEALAMAFISDLDAGSSITVKGQPFFIEDADIIALAKALLDGQSASAFLDSGTPIISNYTANIKYENTEFGFDGALLFEKEIIINYQAGENGSVDNASELVASSKGTVTGSTAIADTGYHFVNWTDADGQEVSTEATFTPTKVKGANVPATYTANFAINKYTVTFVDHDGTVLDTQIVEYGSEATAPAAPTRTGYTFTGWDAAFDNVTEALTVTAQYSINQYTITFVTDGGSEVASIIQDYGSEVTTPENPTREGYTFDGWDVEVPSTMPAEDLTITAKWTINQYTVTFDSTGGSAVEAITQDYGSEVTAPANPTREGYTFDKWIDGKGQEFTFPLTMPVDGLSLKATWTANTNTAYKVHHYQENLAGTYELYETEDLEGTTDTTANATSKTYTGFSESADHADRIISGTIAGDGSLILKRYYLRNFYDLTYKIDGKIYQSTEYKFGATVTPLEAPSKAGYTFNGWANEPETMPAESVEVTGSYTPNTDISYTVKYIDTEGKSLLDAKTVTGQTMASTVTETAEDIAGYTVDEATKNLTLDAENNVITFTYTENANVEIKYISGANGSVSLASESLAPATGEAAGSTATANTGYHFVNWTDADGKEVSTDATFTPAKVGGLNVAGTYTANFAPNTDTEYKVEHYQQNIDDDGYTLVDADTETKSGTTDTTTTETAKEYTGFTAGVVTNVNIDGDGNAVVVIKYDRETYEVKFTDYDWTQIGYTQTVRYQGSATAPTEPTRAGYTFKEWDTAFDSITANLTVKATYTPNADISYTVKYVDTKGNDLLAAKTVTGQTMATTVEETAPEIAGYTVDKATKTLTLEAENNVITFTYTEKDNVEISYKSADEEMGTVSAASESVAPATGTVSGSTATAKEGYAFVNWTDSEGNVVSTDPIFVPEKDTDGLNVSGTYTANFEGTKAGFLGKLDIETDKITVATVDRSGDNLTVTFAEDVNPADVLVAAGELANALATIAGEGSTVSVNGVSITLGSVTEAEIIALAKALLGNQSPSDFLDKGESITAPYTALVHYKNNENIKLDGILSFNVKANMTEYYEILAAVVETDFTEESWATYQAVVTSNVVTEENTKAEVVAATAAIKAAQTDLVFSGQAALEAAIEEADSKIEATYTVSTWSAFRNAYNSAKELPETSNAEVLSKTAAIEAAVNKLVERTTLVVTVNDTNVVYGEDPIFTVNYSGFNGEDNESVLKGTLEFEHEYEKGNNAGTSYVVNAKGLSADDYTIEYQSGTLKVVQRAVTITVDNASKVYGTVDPDFTGTVTGLINEEDLGTITYVREGIDSIVGTYTSVLNATFTDNTNYTVTVTKGDFEITKADVTVKVDDKTKVYGATDPDFTGTVTGLVGTDVLDISYTREEGENVGTYQITANVVDNANYNITTQAGNLNVTKAPITITADNKTSMYGETMAELTYTVTTGEIYGEDNLNIELTKQAGETVGEYDIAVTASNDNYEISLVNGIYSITKATYDMSGVSFESETVTYDGETHSLVISGTLPEDVSVSYTNNGQISAGTYTVTASFTGDAVNYNTIDNMTASLTIEAKEVTITVDNASKVYGTDDPDFTGTVTGLVDGDSLDVSYSRVAGEDVGTYEISAEYTENTNYKAIVTKGNFEITKAHYNMTGVSFESETVTYDGKAHSIAITGTLPTGVTVSYTGNEKTVAGTYEVTAKFEGDSTNYELIADMTATLTIDKAAVTITVDNASKVYGEDDPTLTGTVTGLVNEEDLGTITYVREGTDSTVGTYTGVLNATFTDNANYTVTVNKGNFEITKATGEDLIVTGYEGTYDGNSHNVEVATLIAGDRVFYSMDDGATWTEDLELKDVGIYTVKVKVENPNYEAREVTGTVRITPAPITIKAEDKTSAYGEALLDLTHKITAGEIFNEDDLAITLTKAEGDAEGDAVGIYTITVDATNPNYEITLENGTYTITKGIITQVGDETINDLDIVNRPYNDNSLKSDSIGEVPLKVGKKDVKGEFDLVFYKNETDALADVNPITTFDLSNGGTTFKVYMKATNTTDNLENYSGYVVFKYGSVTVGDNEKYYTIEDALAKANSGTVIVKYNTSFAAVDVGQEVYTGNVKDGILSYEVKSGVTLLLPYNDSFSETTKDTPGNATGGAITRDKAYVELVIPDNIKLDVNGILTVNAMRANIYTNFSGHVTGTNYSQLNLAGKNSKISVENKGVLNSIGFIYGEGSIEAQSGSKVYEPIFVKVFRGGSVTSDVYEELFPFDQYTINSIEADLIVNEGAEFIGKALLYAGSTYFHTDVPLVGKDTKSLLHLSNGKIIKSFDQKIDPEKASTGRVSFDVQGDASFNNIAVSLRYVFFSINANSNNKDLPFDGTWSFNIASGKTLTINSWVMLLPGASVNIEEGATMVISEGGKVTVLDKHYESLEVDPKPYKQYPAVGAENYYRTNTKFDFTNVTPASFTLNGKLIVNGTLTGKVDISDTATIFAPSAKTTHTIKYVHNGAAQTKDVNYKGLFVTTNKLTVGLTQEVEINAIVRDQDGNPLENISVTFSGGSGNWTTTVTTNGAGEATAMYTVDVNDNKITTFTVSARDETFKVNIEVSPIIITVEASPEVIDNNGKTNVTATVMDYSSGTGVPVKGAVVTFSDNGAGGKWSQISAITNEKGEAVSTYTGKFETQDTSKTVTLTVQSQFGTEQKTANTTIEVNGPSFCIADGTLITLADGTQKPVEELTGDELLLVWNLETGSFDVAPIIFIDSYPFAEYEIIHLHFSDGTDVKVIYEHAFWDFNLNKYVYINGDNPQQYLGHWFNKQITDADGNLTWTKVQLVDVVFEYEYTRAWSPVSYEHLSYYTNGMLSMPGGIDGLINTFDVIPGTMKIDQDAYLSDIEEYGLFTYEEFAEIIDVPEEMFDAFQAKYFKVAIGKGHITLDELVSLIMKYGEWVGIE